MQYLITKKTKAAAQCTMYQQEIEEKSHLQYLNSSKNKLENKIRAKKITDYSPFSKVWKKITDY